MVFISLTSVVIGSERSVSIVNQSSNIQLYSCWQMKAIHGDWQSNGVDHNTIYKKGQNIEVDIRSIGEGVQANLTCEFEEVPGKGAPPVHGYMQVDINNEGSYLNFLPASGSISTHVLQTAIGSGTSGGHDVFTISE